MHTRVTFTACRALLAAGLWLLPAAAAAEAADAHSTHSRTGHGSPHFRVYLGGWYSPRYSPYYGGYFGYPPYLYGPAYQPDAAFIDTDIQPEETAVYIDGEYAGTVDDFDGFPDYLAIRPGRHTLTFKAEGHRTVTRLVRVSRGTVLQMDFSLAEGSGEEPIPGKDGGEMVAPDQSALSGSGEERGRVEVGEEEDSQETGPGLIRLRVMPADASVYLDGEFLGTASRVSRLHGDLRLVPGEHRIEVVRPGYRSLSRAVKVVSGDRLTLDLDLEKDGAEPK